MQAGEKETILSDQLAAEAGKRAEGDKEAAQLREELRMLKANFDNQKWCMEKALEVAKSAQDLDNALRDNVLIVARVVLRKFRVFIYNMSYFGEVYMLNSMY